MRATREAAIDLQADALDAFVIDGIEHNIPFLSALMQHPRWREGRLSTGFIAEEFKGGFKAASPAGRGAAAARGRRRRHRPPRQRAPAPDHPADGRAGGALRQPAHRPDRRRRGCWRRSRAALGRPDQGHVPRRPGQAARRRSSCSRTGGRASRCGPAWCMAGRVSVQVRPILNGYDLAYRGIRATRLRLHRARGGARRPDAGEGAARHLQAAALPDAGPGEGDPRGRRARRSRPARRCAWSKP